MIVLSFTGYTKLSQVVCVNVCLPCVSPMIRYFVFHFSTPVLTLRRAVSDPSPGACSSRPFTGYAKTGEVVVDDEIGLSSW